MAIDANGMARMVRSKKHTMISQNLIGDFVAIITVAVSEKKIICTMETSTMKALAASGRSTPVPFITRTGKSISAMPTGTAGAIVAASGTWQIARSGWKM